MASSELRDARGCLTPDGLSLLGRAAPGEAPPELAAHLASCARCQDRLLAADADVVKARGAPRTPPPLWRILALFVLGFGLALLAFVWARKILLG
jgi:hypothetical protein